MKSYGLRGALTLERVRTSRGWPKLKCKGATARSMVRYALQLVQTHGCHTPGGENYREDQLMLGLVQYLCRFYEIIFTESIYLSMSAKEELPQLGQMFAQMYTTLSGIYFDVGLRLFKVSPKLHLWEHLTQHQCLVWGNPRL